MNSVFEAPADPRRRALLDALREEGGQALSDLEAGLALSRFGVAKHLPVLDAAGRVSRVRWGRSTHHHLDAVPPAKALSHWIEPYRVAPAARGVPDLKAGLEAPMDAKPDFVMSTYIRCTQDALWHALTDADTLSAYNSFVDRAERRGDSLIYYFPNGSEMLVIQETKLEPKTRIEATFQPRWEPDAPASRFVYTIEVEGPNCRLVVEHYDIPPSQPGIADGWVRELAGLKTLLETSRPACFASQDMEMGA